MNGIDVMGIIIPAWVIRPGLFLCCIVVLLIFKSSLYFTLRRFTLRTKTKVDDIIIKAANFPINILIFVISGVIVAKILPLASEYDKLINYCLDGLKATTIVAMIIFFERFFIGLTRAYSEKVDILRSTGGFARGFIRLIVYGLGSLVLIDSFGVSITPILASLGVGSLAVALALQPTLENLFSGIQIVADKSIQVGHFIRLDSGEEGYVDKIGWRSTWVRLPPDNVIVIPNKTLVDSKILNYYYPKTEMSFPVEVGVHYHSDLEHVERVTIEVAKETLNSVSGGIKDFNPTLRFNKFADFSINFAVVLRVREFTDHSLIRHEFIKRLHKRYAQEGIIIPYPVQAVDYDQEKVAKFDRLEDVKR